MKQSGKKIRNSHVFNFGVTAFGGVFALSLVCFGKGRGAEGIAFLAVSLFGLSVSLCYELYLRLRNEVRQLRSIQSEFAQSTRKVPEVAESLKGQLRDISGNSSRAAGMQLTTLQYAEKLPQIAVSLANMEIAQAHNLHRMDRMVELLRKVVEHLEETSDRTEEWDGRMKHPHEDFAEGPRG